MPPVLKMRNQEYLCRSMTKASRAALLAAVLLSTLTAVHAQLLIGQTAGFSGPGPTFCADSVWSDLSQGRRVLGLAGVAVVDDRGKGLALGATEYLIKPVDSKHYMTETELGVARAEAHQDAEVDAHLAAHASNGSPT